MPAWFPVYVVSAIGLSALLFRALAADAPVPSKPRVRAALIWTALSAVTGLVCWTLVGCTLGSVLDGQGLPNLQGLAGCLVLSAYFGAFVILMLAPGYLLAYVAYVKYAPRFAPRHPSRAWVAGAAFVLALPGTLAVVASFAGVSEVTSTWRWPEALQVSPIVLPVFWAASYLPRLLTPALRVEVIEGADMREAKSPTVAV